MPSLDAFPLEKQAEALYLGEVAYTKKKKKKGVLAHSS